MSEPTIDVVEERVKELEELFVKLDLAHETNDIELREEAWKKLGNFQVAKKNLETGIQILRRCGRRE